MAVEHTRRRSRRIPIACLGLATFLAAVPGLSSAQEPTPAARPPSAAPEATAPPSGTGSAGAEVLAAWAGGEVTRAEADSWQAFLAGEAATGEAGDGAGRPAPTDEEILELVAWKSLADAARAAGLDATPSVRLRNELVRHTLLAPALRQRVVSGVSVSDEEVESIRRANPDAFHRPRKLKLRNLYRSFGDREPARVRRDMEEIHRKLSAGADFEDLAQEWSESQTAARGGFLGFVDPTDLPAPVAEAVAALSAGGLSRPVEHGGGITLFLCEEVREARAPAPDEVRSKIRQGLERRRSATAWSRYREELVASASPRIDPGAPAVVLELPGYRLGPSDLQALVGLLWPAKDVEPGPHHLARLLANWAEGVVVTRHAVELGLDRDPEVAQAFRWKEMEILARAELARRVQAEVPSPTGEQLRALYEARRARYRELAAYDLAVIDFGPVEDPAGKQRLAGATAVAERIAAGEVTFGEAARRHSKDPSAADGGRLGWKTRREVALWGPAASRPIFALRPGETTRLLHLTSGPTSGLKIFALLDLRKARDVPFEEVRDAVRHAWVQQRLPELGEALRRRHLEEIGVSLRPAPGARPRTLRWVTAMELESHGFDVYRGTSPEGPFTRVNPETIPAAGTSDVPRDYEYEDPTADPGTTYYYYVEAISTGGGRRRLTPVRPSPARLP